MKIINKNNAQLFLILNALFWGSSYIWSKMLLGFLPQFSILFICAILSFITTLIVLRPKFEGLSIKSVLSCVLISMVSVISNTFCMLALKYTSGSNTAFIVQLSIVITPLIMSVLNKRIPRTGTILPALSAIIGIYLITCSGRGLNVNIGDIFALLNALFFSLFIALQNKVSDIVNPVQFTFIQHGSNSIMFLSLAIIFDSNMLDVKNVINPLFLLLIGLSTAITIFTALFQSSAIKFVRPEKATLIYSLEPVTTALLGIIFLGETLPGFMSAAGCIIILCTVGITAINPKVLIRRHRINSLSFQKFN